MPNASVTKTKTVQVTATLTWTGTGPNKPPKRVKVTENALASWYSNLDKSQQIGSIEDPPTIVVNGSMSGSGSTGLKDTITLTPNPQTAASTGKSYAGTREGIYTVPDDGVLILPQVTLTATATATTGDNTQGSVGVTLTSYTVTVPDGKAKGAAWVDIYGGDADLKDANNNPVWTAGAVDYGEEDDSSYQREKNALQIIVSVGAGASKEKDLHPSITYTHTNVGTSLFSFSCNMWTYAAAEVSAINASFVADALSEITSIPGGNTSYPTSSTAHAPNGTAPVQTNYTDPMASYTFSTINGATTSKLTVNAHLKAFASTIGP